MVIISLKTVIMDLLMVIISFEHGNTGKQLILIQFWTWKYWNSSHSDSVLIQDGRTGGRADGRAGGRATGRPGRVTEKHRERIHFGNMYPEKSWYCIYHWILTFWYFFKKDAGRNFMKFGASLVKISHMRPIQARKLKLLKWPFPSDFQMTPTTTTRRQLSHLARPPSHSAQGWNIPFGNPSLRLWMYVLDLGYNMG